MSATSISAASSPGIKTQPTAEPSRSVMAPPRAGWFNPRRVVAWSGTLLVMETILLAFIVLWQHGVFIRIDPPTTTDFVSFFAAGRLTLAGTPMLAYDQASHLAAEVAATAPGILYQFFFYPPVFLLWCAPLALLPYMVAFVLFQAASCAAWLATMRRILGHREWTCFIPVLAFPAVFWNLGLGQNGFVSAALMGGFTLLVDERPLAAGAILGLLCYKPHLALPSLATLFVSGRWKALLSASVTILALVVLSATVFGVDTWDAYLRAAVSAAGVYDSGRIDLAGFVTAYGAARLAGLGSHAACFVQLAVAGVALVAVGWLWQCAPRAERSAALAAGTLLCVPVALVYDLLLTGVAIAWLSGAGRERGFLPGEKAALVFCFLAPLFTWQCGRSLHVSLGLISAAVLVALCVARQLRAAQTASHPLMARQTIGTPHDT